MNDTETPIDDNQDTTPEEESEMSSAEIEYHYGPGSVQWGSWGDPRGR